MSMDAPKKPLVTVYWNDACVDMGEFDEAELDKVDLLPWVTHGYLVKTTKKAYYIAQSAWSTHPGHWIYKIVHLVPKHWTVKVVRHETKLG
jgi:hypothetical protein